MTIDLRPTSVHHTILLYTVSDPGQWTPESIVEDLPELELAQVVGATSELFDAGYLHVNSYDRRLWPLRAGKAALARAS